MFLCLCVFRNAPILLGVKTFPGRHTTFGGVPPSPPSVNCYSLFLTLPEKHRFKFMIQNLPKFKSAMATATTHLFLFLTYFSVSIF